MSEQDGIRKRRLSNRIVFGGIFLAFLVALYLGLAPWLSVARGASGYAAKNLCSGHFVSGFEGDDLMREALVTASPLLGYVSYTIDQDNQKVDTNVLGLFSRRAVYRGDVGCTLLESGAEDLTLDRVTYRKPRAARSGDWPHGDDTPVRSQKYGDLLDEVFAEPDPANATRNTKAVLVVHKGEVIAERYAPGVTAQTPLIGWSMSKSVTGLIAGLMVKDGLLDIHEPAPVPAWHQAEDDPRSAITTDQLLRMSSGLAFDESYTPASDVQNMLSNMGATGAFAASMPLMAEPDTHWSYSSGTSNIVAAMQQHVLGGETEAYLAYVRDRFMTPLGLQDTIFELDQSGHYIGSSYTYASARDWARMGQLCLQNGEWRGKQLLPGDWIAYSAKPTPTSPIGNYGAHFWLNRDPAKPGMGPAWPSLPQNLYMMSGFQGQSVVIIPSHDMVVVRLGFGASDEIGLEAFIAGVIERL